MSTFAVYKVMKVYEETGRTASRSGSGIRDDETAATQLHQILLDSRVDISLSTILRCHTSLGWTFRGSAYCQLIRENKSKS